MKYFNIIYRLLWFLLVLLLIFFNRDSTIWITSTLILLFILSSLAVMRTVESRNQWRNYIKEEKLDD
tara:strand:+ start:90 stop:290 length:201 start_codon:yes stop_codon:yes gene_type:complete